MIIYTDFFKIVIVGNVVKIYNASNMSYFVRVIDGIMDTFKFKTYIRCRIKSFNTNITTNTPTPIDEFGNVYDFDNRTVYNINNIDIDNFTICVKDTSGWIKYFTIQHRYTVREKINKMNTPGAVITIKILHTKNAKRTISGNELQEWISKLETESRCKPLIRWYK